MRTIHALVIVSILTVVGCASGEYSDTYTSPAPISSQATTQTTTEAQGPPAQVTVPTSSIGENAQFVSQQLQMLGFTNINYVSPDGNRFDPQLNDDWTVTQVSPAPGTVVATTNTVTVTATKKQEEVAPVAPAAPLPNISSKDRPTIPIARPLAPPGPHRCIRDNPVTAPLLTATVTASLVNKHLLKRMTAYPRDGTYIVNLDLPMSRLDRKAR